MGRRNRNLSKREVRKIRKKILGKPGPKPGQKISKPRGMKDPLEMTLDDLFGKERLVRPVHYNGDRDTSVSRGYAGASAGESYGAPDKIATAVANTAASSALGSINRDSNGYELGL